MAMTVLVTTGPSHEPIDEVRRLTNASTGELGIRLANRLAKAGFEVGCLLGASSTYPAPLEGPRLFSFTTNDDLLEQLTQLRGQNRVQALFHVAALCDFQVRRVTDPTGADRRAAKIDSRSSDLILHLQPATKIISRLRPLFPEALLVGWKYEMTGDRPAALTRAWQQIRENQTDACVLNGRGFGDGFGFCSLPDQMVEVPGKPELAEFLAAWLAERLGIKDPAAT